MSAAAFLPPPIVKEVRALAIPWFSCLVCMVIPAVVNKPLLLGGISVPAYFLGAAILGALSMGHEYTDRTLSQLLSLPARRERVFAMKLGVLAAMLLPLWFVARTLVFGDARLPQGSKEIAALVPVLCAFFLAPWLTMALRNPIGGAVFTVGIPGALVATGEWIGTGVFGYGYGSELEVFRLTFVWFGTLGICAIGAVMSWRTFMRLEAIEGLGQDVRLPRWLQSRTSAKSSSHELTRHHPVWLLVNKELRLQQLPLVLAGYYALCWLPAAWPATPASNTIYGSMLIALTFLHAGGIPMVIGSTASAGERQIGTLEWQVLLPIAAWKQWAVKVAVILGLGLVLALGVPMALASATRLIGIAGPIVPPVGPAIVVFIILLACGSLYVSSLCRSRLSALVMSLPATLGAWIFLNVIMDWARVGWLLASRVPAVLPLLLMTGFIGILLRFAFTNHRSADRPAARVWRQVIVLAAYVTAAVIVMAAAPALSR